MSNNDLEFDISSNDNLILGDDIVSAIIPPAPYIGENGHWYVYDSDTRQYIDTGINCPQIDDEDISEIKTWSSSKINNELSNKLDVENPVSTGTASFGGTNVVSGWRAFAVGEYNTVKGSKNCAIGDNNTVEGDSAFAIGTANTVRSGFAAGKYNDVGYSCFAFGNNTTSSGDSSVAEGNRTTASGMYSHAEGSDTVAAGMWQHVQGRYNVKDDQSEYVDIIGAGWSPDGTNIETIDWNGNMELSGDLRLYACGGNNPIKVASSLKEANRRIRILEEAAMGKLYTGETVTQTSYKQSVPSGSLSNAIVTQWGGNSVIWNQLNKNNATTQTEQGVTYTNNGDGSWTLTGTHSGTSFRKQFMPDGAVTVVGHKYLVLNGGLDLTDTGCYLCFTTQGEHYAKQQSFVDRMFVAEYVYDEFSVRVAPGFSYEEGITIIPRLVDLTVMFGQGNEPAGMSDQRVPAIKAYAYSHPAYVANQIINADVVSIDTVGANIFDGLDVTNDETTMCPYKNNGIELDAGSYTIAYYENGTPHKCTSIQVIGFDDNSAVSVQTVTKGFSFTLDSKKKVKFKVYGVDMPSPYNAQAITEDYDARQFVLVAGAIELPATFIPHTEASHPIPDTVLSDYPLRSVGNIYDTITWDGEKWFHTQRIESTSFNNMSWQQIEAMGIWYCVDNNNRFKCKKGVNINMRTAYDCNRIQKSAGNEIMVFTLSNSAPSGSIIYELETPVVTDITSLMEGWYGAIEVEAGGTVIFTQGTGKTFAVPNTVNYLIKTTGGA